MDKLTISLFGRFNAHINNEHLIGLKAHKLQELVAYLLLYRDRPHNRERLASQFWGDSSTAQSKKYLRHTFWKLRQSLGDDDGNRPELLLMDGNWVSINPDADYWLDIQEFESAYNAVQKIEGEAMSAEAAAQLKQVLPLYKGELLEGWYHEWCEFERERFQQNYLYMLDKLMCYCETHEEYQEGIDYGNLSLRQDQAQERTHRRLMRLHYLSGNRSAALRQYESCEEILQDYLGVSPSRLTQSLLAQIRGDDLVDGVKDDEQRSTYLDKLAYQLRQLQMELNRFQDQIDSQLNIIGDDV